MFEIEQHLMYFMMENGELNIILIERHIQMSIPHPYMVKAISDSIIPNFLHAFLLDLMLDVGKDWA